MRIHYLQHVPFEDLASIASWASGFEIPFRSTLLFQKPDFPSLKDFDWLMIMGGPMGVADEDRYPWLVQEKVFIREAIEAGKVVLGICLGAQLIASVLGGKVTSNPEKEIGWFPVRLTEAGKKSFLLKDFPETFVAFHWHGDTFSIPEGADHLLTSGGCLHQGFSWEDRVFGFQFHLESTEKSIRDLITHCAGEIIPAAYIQTGEQMKKQMEKVIVMNRQMDTILNRIYEKHFVSSV